MSDPSSGRDPVEELAEEFAARYRRGERPSLTEYTDRYPHLAEQIRALFPALIAMEQFGSVAGPPTGPFEPRGDEDAALPEQLGDYRILREVGRGGMGVVYEAVQESLGRHVALKVLPFHRLMNPTHLERFRREARAAAQLHHTNIVPVFGIGEAEGIHYYAMQFIHGQGLDSVLDEVRRLRDRDSRPAAEASEPLSSASLSIAEGLLTGCFREVPPSSDMTTPASMTVAAPADTQSSLASQTDRQYCRSVARVGVQIAEALAYAHKQRILHRDVKPSNVLLDLLGTVWITDFGLAKAEGSDELTNPGDIVGTLRFMAPERFQGKADPRSDVYSIGITLYEMLTLQPAFADSNRARLMERITQEDPVRPRKLDPHIPRDLETIVLKAMAKEAVGRYPTAEALAEDLRRFLADRPIQARRSSTAEQLWRWCRRNPRVASLTGLAALLLVVIAAGSGVGTLLIWRQTEKTNREKLRAELNLDTAYKVLDEIYLDAAERRLPQQEALTPEDRQFLEKALTFYDGFASQRGNDSSVRQKTALAYLRVASIHMLLGQTEEANANFDQARALAEQLVTEFPANPDYRHTLARCYSDMASEFSGYFDEREGTLRQAVALFEQLVGEYPTNPVYQRDLAEGYARFGLRLHVSRKPDEAEKVFRLAMHIRDQLVEEHPTDRIYRQDLGDSLGRLGNVLSDKGSFEEAGKLFRRSLELRQKLVKDYPRLHVPLWHLSYGYRELAQFLEKTGSYTEAMENYREAVTVRSKLVDSFPGVKFYRGELILSQSQLANVLWHCRRFEEAEQACLEAQATIKKQIHDYPTEISYQNSLIASYDFLAELYKASGRPKEAEHAYEEALALHKVLARDHPSDPNYQHALAMNRTVTVK